MVYISQASSIMLSPDAAINSKNADLIPATATYTDATRTRASKVDRFSALALAAVEPLVERALRLAERNSVAIIIGNSLGGWTFAEKELGNLIALGFKRVSAYQATAWFPAAAQGEITIAAGLPGYAKTVSGGVLCGMEALCLGIDTLLLGKATVAICGVSEVMSSEIAGIGSGTSVKGGEGACFFLLTCAPLETNSVRLQIGEERVRKVSNDYTFGGPKAEIDEDHPGCAMYSLAPMLDMRNLIRLVMDSGTAENFATGEFRAGDRKFSVRLSTQAT